MKWLWFVAGVAVGAMVARPRTESVVERREPAQNYVTPYRVTYRPAYCMACGAVLTDFQTHSCGGGTWVS